MAVTQEEKEAARAYLEHDHAAHTLKGEAAQIANEHAREIDDEHERARDIALTGTANELGELPKHLKAHQLRSRKQAGITTQHAARIRASYRGSGQRGPSGRRGPSAHGREVVRREPERRTVRTVVRDAGEGARSAGSSALDAAGGTSFGGLAVTTIGWAMGLSLLYLVLRNSGNVSRITTGVAHATRAVVAVNVDPLNPHLTLAKR